MRPPTGGGRGHRASRTRKHHSHQQNKRKRVHHRALVPTQPAWVVVSHLAEPQTAKHRKCRHRKGKWQSNRAKRLNKIGRRHRAPGRQARHQQHEGATNGKEGKQRRQKLHHVGIHTYQSRLEGSFLPPFLQNSSLRRILPFSLLPPWVAG